MGQTTFQKASSCSQVVYQDAFFVSIIYQVHVGGLTKTCLKMNLLSGDFVTDFTKVRQSRKCEDVFTLQEGYDGEGIGVNTAYALAVFSFDIHAGYSVARYCPECYAEMPKSISRLAGLRNLFAVCTITIFTSTVTDSAAHLPLSGLFELPFFALGFLAHQFDEAA